MFVDNMGHLLQSTNDRFTNGLFLPDLPKIDLTIDQVEQP